MLSKIAVAGLLFLTTACGLLGNRDAPSKPSNVSANGCLNNISDLVGRYVDGNVSPTEWKAAFGCVNDSLNFFTDYVHGSVNDTYTSNDMYVLVSKFLITNHPVHPALMTGALNLKAALIGGTPDGLKRDEIELVRSTLARLRDITADLIPYLKLRQEANPSTTDLLDLVAAFNRAGDQLADLVNSLPTGMLSDDAVKSLVSELQISLGLPVIQDLSDSIFLAKWILFNTRRDSVESTDWPIFLKTAMGFSGVVIAYKAALGNDPTSSRADVLSRLQNDYRFREYLLALAHELRPYINKMLGYHHNIVPFPLFDHVIDHLPDGLLDRVPKSTLKNFLRPLFNKLLLSPSKLGLDPGVVNTVYAFLDDLVKDLGQVDRMYESTGLDRLSSSPVQLNRALTQYSQTLEGADLVRFGIIKEKLLTYPALLYQDTGRIRFQVDNGYAKQQHSFVLAVDRFVRLLSTHYASSGDHFSDDDLTFIFHEYQDILFAIKAVDPTVADFGKKRKNEMDLFTAASDGDGLASVPEIVNWGLITFSAYNMTNQIRASITPKCDAGLGIDLMDWTRLPATCFRKEFNQRLSIWLDDFPRLQKYWATLDQADQEKAMLWLEHGARRNGYSEVDFDKFDMTAMATLLHYTESLFSRFDADNSEYLSKDEVKSAYPVFKLILAQKANLSASNDFLLKGAFTYIVKYRAMPQMKGISNLSKLAWWLGIYALPTTNYGTDRLGVFNIVCQLASPESASQQAATPTVCR